MDNQTAPRSFQPRRISWLTIVLALLALVTFFAISRPNLDYPVPMGIGVTESGEGYRALAPETAPGITTPEMMVYPDRYPYPYYDPDVPISDQREFLKIYYSASMRTRDVPGLTRRVETTVQGYDGRIDQESSSQKYGSVSFALPQSKYDAFRVELESLVDSRFLTINISSQNLLPEKLSIEEQQKRADALLSDYKTARQKIVNTHLSAVKSLRSKIDSAAEQLAALRAETKTPQILAQIEIVSDEWSSFKQELSDENAAYALQLDNTDRNIKYAEDWQKAVQTRDQTLLDRVATVTGTVSIQWISLWDSVQLYLPSYWIPTIFAALALLSFLRDRRRFALA